MLFYTTQNPGNHFGVILSPFSLSFFISSRFSSAISLFFCIIRRFGSSIKIFTKTLSFNIMFQLVIMFQKPMSDNFFPFNRLLMTSNLSICKCKSVRKRYPIMKLRVWIYEIIKQKIPNNLQPENTIYQQFSH